MFYNEHQNHSNDCNFYSFNVQGFSLINIKDIMYLHVGLAIHPVPYEIGIVMPSSPLNLVDTCDDQEIESKSLDNINDQNDVYNPTCEETQLFT